MTPGIRLSHALGLPATTAAIALSVIAMTLDPPPAVAAAPMVKTQAPGFYRTMLGEFEVTVINDGTFALDADKLLVEPPATTEAALKQAFESNPIETSSNTFLINTGTKLVLVDSGAGTLLGPTAGKLLINLRAAGYKPEQIDDIFVTHMHPDHVGGLMTGGERAFPNATIHADKRESDFWLSQANLDKAPADAKGSFQSAMASVNPYAAVGKYQPFDTDRELVPGVRSIATYGHTAGHTSYLVHSKGQNLMIIGDLIHVAAVQLPDPGVTITFDSDASAAAATRKKVFGEIAADSVLMGAEHLQFPALGHLRAVGDSWQWVPVNYSTVIR